MYEKPDFSSVTTKALRNLERQMDSSLRNYDRNPSYYYHVGVDRNGLRFNLDCIREELNNRR